MDLPESRTIEGSGAVFGWGPNSEPVGVSLPLYPGSGKSPRGDLGTTSPWLGAFLDNTSTLSVGQGVEAVGSESLFISDESKEPSTKIRRDGLETDCIIIFDIRRNSAIKHTMNYYGIRILTT